MTSSILESITRSSIATIVGDILKRPFVERTIDRTELYLAEELFFLGTGWEIMPVASVDRLPIADGKVGSITSEIREAYADIVRGVDTRYPDWRTPVWEE